MARIVDGTEMNMIGDKLRALRTANGWSQQAVSDKLEMLAIYVCRGSISRIEDKQRTVTDIELYGLSQVFHGKRQTTPRMDRHETIVTGRCETFRYCRLLEDIKMTSAELKHRVKLQEWAARIQDCRSSGLSVRAWCRQEEISATTYYRWERELLALAETEPCSSVSAVRFAELPAPKQVSRNVAERSATLHIGNASLDIYPGCDTEQLRLLVELLRLC